MHGIYEKKEDNEILIKGKFTLEHDPYALKGSRGLAKY